MAESPRPMASAKNCFPKTLSTSARIAYLKKILEYWNFYIFKLFEASTKTRKNYDISMDLLSKDTSLEEITFRQLFR